MWVKDGKQRFYSEGQSGEWSVTIKVKVLLVEEPFLNTAVWCKNDMHQARVNAADNRKQKTPQMNNKGSGKFLEG